MRRSVTFFLALMAVLALMGYALGENRSTSGPWPIQKKGKFGYIDRTTPAALPGGWRKQEKGTAAATSTRRENSSGKPINDRFGVAGAPEAL